MKEIYALLKKCFVWVSEMETFWEMTGREVKEDEKDHEEIFVFCLFCFDRTVLRTSGTLYIILGRDRKSVV